MHRSVAKIIFCLHDHMPRAHNIHVMYNFEHHSSQVAAEWGVCVVIADVRHTVKNVCFSTSVQKLLTLLFSPFTQTWLTIWPSKKCTSHTNINLKKFNPFCPLSLHTFWHLVTCINTITTTTSTAAEQVGRQACSQNTQYLLATACCTQCSKTVHPPRSIHLHHKHHTQAWRNLLCYRVPTDAHFTVCKGKTLSCMLYINTKIFYKEE